MREEVSPEMAEEAHQGVAGAAAQRKEQEWWQLGDQTVAGWFGSAQQSLFGACDALNVEWQDFSPGNHLSPPLPL